MKRIEDQIVLLRQTAERNATEHAELVEDVKSLGNLVRTMGAGLAILLIVLIVLTSLLLSRHH
jgi:cell division protein FtsX